PDLVVHRILKAALALSPLPDPPPPGEGVKLLPPAGGGREGGRAARQLAIATERLGEIAEHTSKRERVAMDAERDVVELKKVQYMQQHLGEEFDGYISGVTAFGLFVELGELFVEGLIHISTLDDDLYTHMEKQHSLIGRHSKRVFRIGDPLRVKVAAVLPATRRIEFVLVSHTPSAPAARPRTGSAATEEYPRIALKGKSLAGLKRGTEGRGSQKEEKGSRGSRKGPSKGKR
ncbi:MAG: S1 RNA-binding domain-containing protein, partial [Desulfuromonadales bacterium]|nr:S1 RNA-binding domain-containing protein [Desulfuromonadales bacterium]